MTQILLVTVGGSPQPILTAIDQLQPDRVVFICSTGKTGSDKQVLDPGKPCKVYEGGQIVRELKNLPTQARLDSFDRDRDLVRLQNLDDIGSCYTAIAQKVRELRAATPDATLQADYTGGTKTMSLALAAVALDLEIPLFVTTGTRTDLQRVRQGEATERANTSAIAVQRRLQQFLPVALKGYHYAAAAAEINAIAATTELPAAQKQYLRDLRDYCNGFDAWDRFDHATAFALLANHRRQEFLRPALNFLQRAIASRAPLDPDFDSSGGKRGHGYEIVQDLLLNADRCAQRERYDDAVGRLYRTLELLAQVRLKKQYEIATGKLDLQALPEILHDRYRDRHELALMDSYDLLSDLDEIGPSDPLGLLWRQHRNAICNALQIRNYSILAHGFQPIDRDRYDSFAEVVVRFIETGINELVPTSDRPPAPQFPTQFPALDNPAP